MSLSLGSSSRLTSPGLVQGLSGEPEERESSDRGVRQGLTQGGVGGDGDASLTAEVQQLCLAEVGMTLHLVSDGLDAAPGQDVLDLFGVKVRDS